MAFGLKLYTISIFFGALGLREDGDGSLKRRDGGGWGRKGPVNHLTLYA